MLRAFATRARVPLSSLRLAGTTRGIGGAPGWRWHEDGTNIIRGIIEFGPALTLRKLLHMKEVRFGNKVGVDSMGNTYFENLNYQYGRHRWVEYAGLPWQSEVQQTSIDADWYGWLHYTTDVRGNDYSLHQGGEINQGSDIPYDTNLGAVIEPFEQNKTDQKVRAYNDGVSPAGDGYWKQPSHPTYQGPRGEGPSFHEERVEEWTPPGEATQPVDPKNEPVGFKGKGFTRSLDDY